MAENVRFEIDLQNIPAEKLPEIKNDLLQKIISESLSDPDALKVEFSKHVKATLEWMPGPEAVVITTPVFNGQQTLKLTDLKGATGILDVTKFK